MKNINVVKEKNFSLYVLSLITLIVTFVVSNTTNNDAWGMIGFLVFVITSFVVFFQSSNIISKLVMVTWVIILLGLLFFVFIVGPVLANAD